MIQNNFVSMRLPDYEIYEPREMRPLFETALQSIITKVKDHIVFELKRREISQQIMKKLKQKFEDTMTTPFHDAREALGNYQSKASTRLRTPVDGLEGKGGSTRKISSQNLDLPLSPKKNTEKKRRGNSQNPNPGRLNTISQSSSARSLLPLSSRRQSTFLDPSQISSSVANTKKPRKSILSNSPGLLGGLPGQSIIQHRASINKSPAFVDQKKSDQLLAKVAQGAKAKEAAAKLSGALPSEHVSNIDLLTSTDLTQNILSSIEFLCKDFLETLLETRPEEIHLKHVQIKQIIKETPEEQSQPNTSGLPTRKPWQKKLVRNQSIISAVTSSLKGSDQEDQANQPKKVKHHVFKPYFLKKLKDSSKAIKEKMMNDLSENTMIKLSEEVKLVASWYDRFTELERTSSKQEERIANYQATIETLRMNYYREICNLSGYTFTLEKRLKSRAAKDQDAFANLAVGGSGAYNQSFDNTPALEEEDSPRSLGRMSKGSSTMLLQLGSSAGLNQNSVGNQKASGVSGFPLMQMNFGMSLGVGDDPTALRVHFFDPTDGLDLSPKVNEMLNSKLRQIKDNFQNIINNLTVKNDELQGKIHRFRELNKEFVDQTGFISIDHLDLETMIEKLFIVSENPKEIWTKINDLRPGFFVRCIQEDFGVGSNFTKRLIVEFEQEAKKLSDDHEREIAATAKEFKKSTEKQNKIISDLQHRLGEVTLQYSDSVEELEKKVKVTIMSTCNTKVEELRTYKEEALKKYRKDLWEAEDRVRALEFGKGKDKDYDLLDIYKEKCLKLEDEVWSLKRENAYLQYQAEKFEVFANEFREKFETIEAVRQQEIEYVHLLEVKNHQNSSMIKQIESKDENTKKLLQTLENKSELLMQIFERHSIFNPILAKYDINPTEKMKEERKKVKFQRKNRVPMKVKYAMMGKSRDVHTLTEICYVDRELNVLSRHKKLSDLRPPKEDFGVQTEPMGIHKATDVRGLARTKEISTQTKLTKNTISELLKFKSEVESGMHSTFGNSEKFRSFYDKQSQNSNSLKKKRKSLMVNRKDSQALLNFKNRLGIKSSSKHIGELTPMDEIKENIADKMHSALTGAMVNPKKKQKKKMSIPLGQLIGEQEEYENHTQGSVSNDDNSNNVEDAVIMESKDLRAEEDEEPDNNYAFPQSKDEQDQLHPNVLAMRRKQMEKLRRKATGRSQQKKKGKDGGSSSRRSDPKFVKVGLYGIKNLEIFMEKQLDKKKRVTQSTQTFESSFSIASQQANAQAHKQALFSLMNCQRYPPALLTSKRGDDGKKLGDGGKSLSLRELQNSNRSKSTFSTKGHESFRPSSMSSNELRESQMSYFGLLNSMSQKTSPYNVYFQNQASKYLTNRDTLKVNGKRFASKLSKSRPGSGAASGTTSSDAGVQEAIASYQDSLKEPKFFNVSEAGIEIPPTASFLDHQATEGRIDHELSSDQNILDIMMEKEPKWHEKEDTKKVPFVDIPLLKENAHKRNYTSVYGSKEKLPLKQANKEDEADKQIKKSIFTLEHLNSQLENQKNQVQMEKLISNFKNFNESKESSQKDTALERGPYKSASHSDKKKGKHVKQFSLDEGKGPKISKVSLVFQSQAKQQSKQERAKSPGFFSKRKQDQQQILLQKRRLSQVDKKQRDYDELTNCLVASKQTVGSSGKDDSNSVLTKKQASSLLVSRVQSAQFKGNRLQPHQLTGHLKRTDFHHQASLLQNSKLQSQLLQESSMGMSSQQFMIDKGVQKKTTEQSDELTREEIPLHHKTNESHDLEDENPILQRVELSKRNIKVQIKKTDGNESEGDDASKVMITAEFQNHTSGSERTIQQVRTSKSFQR